MKKLILSLLFASVFSAILAQNTESQNQSLNNVVLANPPSSQKTYNALNALNYSKVSIKGVFTAGGTNTYTVTVGAGVSAYPSSGDQLAFDVLFTNGNSGSSTLNVNGLGAKTLKKSVSTNLSSGDILAGGIYRVAYDGTNFQIVGGLSSGGGAGTWGSITGTFTDQTDAKAYIDATSLLAINTQASSYTLVLTDGTTSTGKNTMIIMTDASAKNLTVPLNSSVAFPIGTQIPITNVSGLLTVVETGGVTITPTGGDLTVTAGAVLVKEGTDTWRLHNGTAVDLSNYIAMSGTTIQQGSGTVNGQAQLNGDAGSSLTIGNSDNSSALAVEEERTGIFSGFTSLFLGTENADDAAVFFDGRTVKTGIVLYAANGTFAPTDSSFVTKKWVEDNAGGGAVSSVFSRTGDVVAASGDYDAVFVTNTPAGGIAATEVQSAINELDTEKVPNGRTIGTTSPLSGGGDLSANRTLTIANAAADGSTKGAASFNATYFDASSGNISPDLTNGLASGSQGGYLSSADFTKLRERKVALACSDLVTVITTGTTKAYYDFSAAFTITSVRATILTAQTSGTILTIDINESGTTILSTKLTIDNSETSSATAATAAVISDTSIAANARITIDFDAVGASGAGVIVEIVGYYN